jgi:hypothetical protein
MEDSLKSALQSFDSTQSTRYIAAFKDLNGDGNLEGIVYLVGGKWCGSGGCTTLILLASKLHFGLMEKAILEILRFHQPLDWTSRTGSS